MTDYRLKGSNSSASGRNDFINGLVFGFDVGTGSIGYAVRQGKEFKDVGVLICDSEGSDLSKRRDLRRQRRTLRSRKYRRKWFAKELEKLGLKKPAQFPDDPISLRCSALNGDELKPEELYAALAHLFKRRGYTKVPWANEEKATKENAKPKKEDEEGEIKKAVTEIQKAMQDKNCKFPCELLALRKKEIGESPTKEWARKIYWPREALRDEFLAIAKAQKKNFPQLLEKADWLLYGDAKEVKGHHVFFKATEARNPGILGLRWPRFDNRGPALDSLQPVDEKGRPLHVVRKNKEVFEKAQWELAVMNFRVIEIATGKLVSPDSKSMARLREIWESRKRGKKIKDDAKQKPKKDLEISKSVLDKWAEDFSKQYKLVEGQQSLTPETGAGRARYSSPTLQKIISGERFNPPQPILRRNGENTENALNRYLSNIKHPLVRHRLTLFRRLLARLVSQHGEPKMIILEAARSLAMGKNKKREHIQKIHDNREERTNIRNELKKDGFSSSKNSILRYRLFKEAKGRCPFCLCPFCLQEVLLKDAEIEHIVPRSCVDCNEFSNLTVAHRDCNQRKDNRTPWEAFGQTDLWEGIRKNAEECFGLGSLKYRLFTSSDAENLIEQKADLQQTAYIARVIRHVALIQLGWLGDDGRDPTIEKGNKPSSSFQVTNGQLTSRLRTSWGLNQILHPLPNGVRWNELSEEEQKQFSEKNREDLRHHALDAMVISCTLPWLAHRTVRVKDPQTGEDGWWSLDERTQRSIARNPLFPREGEMYEAVTKQIEKIIVRPHVSRSNNGKKLDTTPLSLRTIEEKNQKREVFVARRPLREKSPDALKDIFSTHLKNYISAEWSLWSQANPDWDKENKGPSKGKLPERFINQLVDPIWKKPIRSVKFIVEKSKSSVFKVGEHPTGERRDIYVAYGENKQVNVFTRTDGKGFVAQPIRPCYPKDKKPALPPSADKHLFTLRRGTLFRLNENFKIGKREVPIDIYRIVALPGEADARVSFFPHYQNTSSIDGERLAPIRADIEKLAGFMTILPNNRHELPHSPSVKPQSAGAAEA